MPHTSRIHIPMNFSGRCLRKKRLFAGKLMRFAHKWQHRARQRHHLMQLDHRLLKDIGLDEHAAAQESEKPFWLA